MKEAPLTMLSRSSGMAASNKPLSYSESWPRGRILETPSGYYVGEEGEVIG